jgi:hypothetical protein
MEVVRARFHIPAAMLARIRAAADPVVTCNDDCLRFEAFSGCAGVYARIDFTLDAIETDRFGRGTTNVDFHAPMIAALARVRDNDRLSLAVGAKSVELMANDERIIEKKVALPVRWLKGFVEVQAYQPRLAPVHELTGVEALRFLRGLPRMKTGVSGSGVEHRVRLSESGGRCTCPWYSKHQGQRGPYKHVLAAQMFADKDSPSE